MIYAVAVKCVFKRNGARVPVWRDFVLEAADVTDALHKGEALADQTAACAYDWIEFVGLGANPLTLPLELSGQLLTPTTFTRNPGKRAKPVKGATR